MGNFFIDDNEWSFIFHKFDVKASDLEKIVKQNEESIYSSLMNEKKNKQAEELSIQEKLSTLMAMINFSLDCGNREEFMGYSKQYNELKLQLI